MTNFKHLKRLGAASAFAILAFATPAFAGECPAGDVAPNAMQAGATEPSRVTDTVIASIDLSQAYGIPGRSLRMRRLEVEPQGVVPWHDHSARPANIYIVSGEITEYRSTCRTPITHRAGDVVAEQGNTQHWWRNNSRRRAVLISADILPPQMPMNSGEH